MINRRGHYRFLRTKRGRSHFARVGVELQPGGEASEVVNSLPEQVDPNEGEVNRHMAPSWVTAALEGIQMALAYASRTGALVTGCRAFLVEVVGTPVDTREDAVRCAAGLAVWDALGDPGLAPEAEFDGQTWQLVFPTIPSPVQGIPQ